jgi:hypothetical protein
LAAGRKFGTQREKVIGVWRKQHTDELDSFYSLTNTVTSVKSKRVSWACIKQLDLNKIFVGIYEDERLVGRDRLSWCITLK